MQSNVVILINTLLKGGSEKQAVLLAKALKNEFNVWMIIYYGNSIIKEHENFLEKEKINILRLDGSHFKRIIRLISFIKQESIEFIFSYLMTSNVIGGIIGKLFRKVKTFGGIRSSYLLPKKIFPQKIAQNYLNDFTIYNNFKGAENLTKQGFYKDKAIVIQNCVSPPNKLTIRSYNENVNILSVGRFDFSKDYFTALKSIQLLKEKKTNFIYNVIGYGELENQIRDWIKELGITDITNVVINPEGIEKYYLDADIYLSTSIFEGLSNTILEAMTYNLPVIATNVGDNPLIIKNNFNGFLANPGDEKLIADNLLCLINDFNLRLKLGTNAYNHVKTGFSFDKFKSKYISLINSVN